MKKVLYFALAMMTAMVSMTACEDVPEPYNNPNNNSTNGGGSGSDTTIVVDAKGSGTLEDPYNVAAANALLDELGASVNSEDVYVLGIISKINEVDPSYGNATYYISDNGSTDNQLMVYRGYYFGGSKFSSEDQIQEGDTVIIYGKLVYYNGKTKEFTQGNYIYSLNGSTTGGSTGATSYSYTFTESQGGWNIVDVNLPSGLNYVWQQNASYGMKASAYASSTNYASESWLISPALDLSAISAPTITVSHAGKFFANSVSDDVTYYVSTDYTSGAPSTATWTALTIDAWPSNSDWTFVDGKADLSAVGGKTGVVIGIKYTSTDAKAGTYEVKTIAIQ